VRDFKSNVVLKRIKAAVAAGQTTQVSDVVDTNGYDSVILVAMIGSIADTGTVVVQAQQGDLSNGNDQANIEAPSAVSFTASDDNKVATIEINRPKSRYVCLSIARGTADSAIDGCIALLTDPTTVPVTRDTTTEVGCLSLHAPDDA
jgi:hypothetical protein